MDVGQTTAGDAFEQGGRVAGHGRPVVRSLLAAAQVALSLMLLIGAGLMAKSLWTLTSVSPGFRMEHVLTAGISLPTSRYPDAARIAAFQRDLLDRVRSTPGVRSAGLTAHLPLGGTDNSWSFDIEGRPPLPPGVDPTAQYGTVTPGYLETLGIPLLRGRAFADDDGEGAPPVVIVNASMARVWWPGENPVGQRLRLQGRPAWRTVVGVVGDVRHQGLDAVTRPEIYAPFAQMPNTQSTATLVVRTATEPTALAATLRRIAADVDSNLPLDRVQTMQDVVWSSVGQPRFRTALLSAVAVLALALASVGVYGVLSYLVSLRTREFGIRLAVGATTGEIVSLVLRRAGALVAGGLAAGLLGAAVLTRSIAGLLYEVRPLDPGTFTLVPLVLVGVAFLASYIPARRATRVDPVVALRSD
jgi:putative ABC transport system permease protein